MTTSYNWPGGLPIKPTVAGYGEGAGVLVQRSPMDAGPAKLRRVGARPDVLSLGYQMTTAQLGTLETFVKTTLLGVRRFNFTHPRTGNSQEVRLVPGRDGDFYTTAYIGPGLWHVEMSIEVLP